MSTGDGADRSTEDSDSESGEIAEKSVEELVRSVRKAPKGSYAFFIGAGASYPEPANIPLAGDFIEEFQEELYDELDPDVDDVEDWAEEYQENHKEPHQNEYGFWFSEAYPVPGARREKIRAKVEQTEPPFGQIILASMMDDGIIDHTLTPNFDDLLFDAFYNFTDERPLYIDHEAKAPRLNMSSDDSAIVKLHGDYLHYTQNTTAETASLKENIRERFEQSLHEYGLIVVGYGGGDEAIMEVLERDSFSEHGLFWCAYSEPSEKVQNLLKNAENAYLVDIDGADSLFYELWDGIEGVTLPQPDEIKDQAENRIDTIERRKTEIEGRETSEEDSSPGRIWEANQTMTEGNPEEAIGILDEVIQNQEESARAYHQRALAKQRADDLRGAVEDYSEAIKRASDKPNAYYYYNRGNAERKLGRLDEAIEDTSKYIDLGSDKIDGLNLRGAAKAEAGDYEGAILDFKEALSMEPGNQAAKENLAEAHVLDEEYEEAIEGAEELLELADDDSDRLVAMMFQLLAKILDGRETSQLETEYRTLCEDTDEIDWNFSALENWMSRDDLPDEKKDRVQEIINLLHQNRSDGDSTEE